VEAILHASSEKIAASLSEGGYQQRGGLDVRYGILSGVVSWQKSAGLLGGEAGRGQG
jgi:hypothetical protein